MCNNVFLSFSLGKVYAAKTQESAKNVDLNIKLDADWEHALEEASEEDLVDLAGNPS